MEPGTCKDRDPLISLLLKQLDVAICGERCEGESRSNSAVMLAADLQL